MLENDGVGARSGISSVRGSARSQKYWKERRSTSSRSAASETVEGGSCGTGVPAQRNAARARRSVMILRVKRSSSPVRSEVDLQPDLLPARQVDHAGRVAEVGVSPGSDEVVQTAVARPVEG